MPSSESSTPDRTPQPCALASSFFILDAAAIDDEMQIAFNSQSWMVTTVIDIEDDDLMFGGKPLCTWYEEDRRRLSLCVEDDEEETRGRQRERAGAADGHPHHHRHQQHQHHQQPQPQHKPSHHPHHHRHHSKKSKDAKA
jgi:hypothetical protein